MSSITVSDYVKLQSNGKELARIVTVLLNAYNSSQSGVTYGTTPVLGSMYLNTATAGKLKLNLFISSWVTLFEVDTATGVTKIGNISILDAAGGAVSTVNNRVSPTVINDVYSTTTSMTNKVIEGLHTATYIGAVIKFHTDLESNINIMLSLPGTIAYASDSDKFYGRTATRWEELGAGDSQSIDIPYNIANRALLSALVGDLPVAATEIPPLGAGGKILRGSGGKIIYSNVSESAEVLNTGVSLLDWSKATNFKVSATTDMSIVHNNATDGRVVTFRVKNVGTNRINITLPANSVWYSPVNTVARPREMLKFEFVQANGVTHTSANRAGVYSAQLMAIFPGSAAATSQWVAISGDGNTVAAASDTSKINIYKKLFNTWELSSSITIPSGTVMAGALDYTGDILAVAVAVTNPTTSSYSAIYTYSGGIWMRTEFTGKPQSYSARVCISSGGLIVISRCGLSIDGTIYTYKYTSVWTETSMDTIRPTHIDLSGDGVNLVVSGTGASGNSTIIFTGSGAPWASFQSINTFGDVAFTYTGSLLRVSNGLYGRSENNPWETASIAPAPADSSKAVRASFDKEGGVMIIANTDGLQIYSRVYTSILEVDNKPLTGSVIKGFSMTPYGDFAVCTEQNVYIFDAGKYI